MQYPPTPPVLSLPSPEVIFQAKRIARPLGYKHNSRHATAEYCCTIVPPTLYPHSSVSYDIVYVVCCGPICSGRRSSPGLWITVKITQVGGGGFPSQTNPGWGKIIYSSTALLSTTKFYGGIGCAVRVPTPFFWQPQQYKQSRVRYDALYKCILVLVRSSTRLYEYRLIFYYSYCCTVRILYKYY